MIPSVTAKWDWNSRKNEPGETVTVPNNILRFEAALYLSLMLDTLSAALQHVPDTAGEPTDPTASFINAVFILSFVFLVGHAARRRKNWARITLLVALVLAMFSLAATLSSDGFKLSSGIDLLSTALTTIGLYYSFTGNARGWFTG